VNTEAARKKKKKKKKKKKNRNKTKPSDEGFYFAFRVAHTESQRHRFSRERAEIKVLAENDAAVDRVAEHLDALAARNDISVFVEDGNVNVPVRRRFKVQVQRASVENNRLCRDDSLVAARHNAGKAVFSDLVSV
jgi:hypothetical protein